ncbi:MAG: biotin carboxylase N-terminal domain-containing protein [Actinomycetota bacterium]
MVELRRLLIANRGEIAVRIVRACREMGISPVIAIGPGEQASLAAEIADAIVDVPSYLDAGSIVRAGVEAAADAVHPGYGFLAEDAAFAELVLEAGLVWVGPPPEAMRALGDKVAARAVAEAAGVPVVPGSAGEGLSDGALIEQAERLGLPLLVKAAAGGGGRGMRTVEELADLPGALAAAREEAAASFGDERVFLERRLGKVHHVEVQVLLDDHGNAVHLGERDCSLQRRHQKIVEESPSPTVDDAMRETLGEAAIAIAERAGYRGAGTAEFLLGDDGDWWFLEMNARLQVEHPVTEAVAGVDLVRAQLAMAAGAPLGFDQGDVALRGHAIEVRIYAEDPANGFLPSGGRVDLLDLPRWPGVRIDTALREGDVVGLGYDPLLAKVIAWAEDRQAAIARLSAALDEVRIVGLATNLGFLLDVLERPEMRDGTADTDWVEAMWTPRVPVLPDDVIADRGISDPWIAFGAAGDAGDAGRAPTRGVTVAGAHAQFQGWSYEIADDEHEATELAPPGGSLVAPMPASVLRVEVAVGDTVAAGQVVALLEAMKIQVQIVAPAAGSVNAVHVVAGDVVARGEVLIEVVEP